MAFSQIRFGSTPAEKPPKKRRLFDPRNIHVPNKPHRHHQHHQQHTTKHHTHHLEWTPHSWDLTICFVFSTKTGTLLLGIQGFTLMLVTLLVHFYEPNEIESGPRSVQNTLIYTYLGVMMTALSLAMASAYFERSIFANLAATVMLVGTALYFVFFILSFITESMIGLYVCPGLRCPDHHWLQDSTWRGKLLYNHYKKRYMKDVNKEIVIKDMSSLEENSEHALLLRDKFAGLISNKYNMTSDFEALQDLEMMPEEYFLAANKTKKPRKPITEPPPPPAFPELRNPRHYTIPGALPGRDLGILDHDDEGNVFLITISVSFGIIICGYFIYCTLTFYSYGMYLKERHR